jgi:hypothetical protein
MGNQLTKEEMQDIYDVFRGDPPEDDQIDDARWDSICTKMQAGISALEEQEAHAAVAITETFPERISQEEAELYQHKGSKMMLDAAKQKLSEKDHADISCLWIGLVGGICQCTAIPRAVFSNTMAANVGFTALKAAFFNGRKSND